MKKQILFFLILAFFASCSFTRETTTQTEQTSQTVKADTVQTKTGSTSETIQKTIEYIQIPDEASIKALIECDSNYNAILTEYSGYRAGTEIKLNQSSERKGKILYVTTTATVDSFKVYKVYKQRYDNVKTETKAKTNTKTQTDTQTETIKETKFKLGPELKFSFLLNIVLLFGVIYLAKKKRLI